MVFCFAFGLTTFLLRFFFIWILFLFFCWFFFFPFFSNMYMLCFSAFPISYSLHVCASSQSHTLWATLEPPASIGNTHCGKLYFFSSDIHPGRLDDFQPRRQRWALEISLLTKINEARSDKKIDTSRVAMFVVIVGIIVAAVVVDMVVVAVVGYQAYLSHSHSRSACTLWLRTAASSSRNVRLEQRWPIGHIAASLVLRNIHFRAS